MEVLFVLGILLIAYIGSSIQKWYWSITEKGKFWVTCYRCHGKGSIRGEGYGTNGVEIWPLYDTCPNCQGRGKVEDHARNQNASTAVKTKPRHRDKKLFGLKMWQFIIVGGLVLLLMGILTGFVFIYLNM